MGNIPADLKYSEVHEWVRLEGSEAIIGITDHAQESLSDVVYVELPAVGSHLQRRRQVRRGRIGQGRLGPVHPVERHGDGGQRGAGRRIRRW